MFSLFFYFENSQFYCNISLNLIILLNIYNIFTFLLFFTLFFHRFGLTLLKNYAKVKLEMTFENANSKLAITQKSPKHGR
jgi:hypothetical protein